MKLTDIFRGLNDLLKHRDKIASNRNIKRLAALQEAWDAYNNQDLGDFRDTIQDRFDEAYHLQVLRKL